MSIDIRRIAIAFAIVAPMWAQTVAQAIGRTVADVSRGSSQVISRGDSAERKMDLHVAALIKKMLSRKTEQKAFADLEALGCAAVPAIIAQMDDRRDLQDPRIALTNKSPDAWEGRRFYGPKKIVDVLAAILNQITGEDFGFIYNGDVTDAERTKTIEGWREFLRKKPKSMLCGRG
jgi:hypothetical protein